MTKCGPMDAPTNSGSCGNKAASASAPAARKTAKKAEMILSEAADRVAQTVTDAASMTVTAADNFTTATSDVAGRAAAGMVQVGGGGGSKAKDESAEGAATKREGEGDGGGASEARAAAAVKDAASNSNTAAAGASSAGGASSNSAPAAGVVARPQAPPTKREASEANGSSINRNIDGIDRNTSSRDGPQLPPPTLTTDPTTMTAILASLAAATTYRHFHEIWNDGTVPLSAAMLWFAIGVVGSHVLWPNKARDAQNLTTQHRVGETEKATVREGKGEERDGAFSRRTAVHDDWTQTPRTTSEREEGGGTKRTRLEQPIAEPTAAEPPISRRTHWLHTVGKLASRPGSNVAFATTDVDEASTLTLGSNKSSSSRRGMKFLPSTSAIMNKIPSFSPSLGSMKDIPNDMWTTLQKRTTGSHHSHGGGGDRDRGGGGGRRKSHWEQHCSDEPSSELKFRLSKYKDFRTKRHGEMSSRGSCIIEPPSGPHAAAELSKGGKIGKKEGAAAAAAGDAGIDDDGGGGGISADDLVRIESIGRIDTHHPNASVLESKVEVDPLFHLRGMDVFKTDCPEGKIWRQPILEESGLRDVPTFLVNVMVPWCNLVLYFQMPDWVKRFQDIREEETDSEDTKALKRFLTGNDAYRNARWKVLPCLVDGPMLIRMMAPEAKEITIEGAALPLTWQEHNETIDPKTGRTRAALLEVDCDLISDARVRKIVNLVRNSIKKVSIDCAMIVDKPVDSKGDEPSACLGLWRMDKIDMDSCAVIPERTEDELLREASVLMSRRNAVLVESIAGMDLEVDEYLPPEVTVTG